MLTAEARIETKRPSRYLIQLGKHAAAMAGTGGHRLRLHSAGGALARREVQVHAEWSDTEGCIRFDPWGQCTITIGDDVLLLRVEATDEDNLRRLQDLLARDLGRFGQREQLTVNWRRPEAPSGGPPA